MRSYRGRARWDVCSPHGRSRSSSFARLRSGTCIGPSTSTVRSRRVAARPPRHDECRGVLSPGHRARAVGARGDRHRSPPAVCEGRGDHLPRRSAHPAGAAPSTCETTKAIERSHMPMRDRLRNSRGLKRTETGQRFLEGFEAVRHLWRGGRPGAGHLVRGPAHHTRVREVVAAIHTLGHGLRRQP
jgi:hypothetical protein